MIPTYAWMWYSQGNHQNHKNAESQWNLRNSMEFLFSRNIIGFSPNRPSETCPDRYVFVCFSLPAWSRFHNWWNRWFLYISSKSCWYHYFVRKSEILTLNENDIRLSSPVEMYSIPIGFQCWRLLPHQNPTIHNFIKITYFWNFNGKT